MNNLLKYWLIKYRKSEEGFTFLECLMAIIVLSLAFALNGQMVLMSKMQNLKQKIESAAVALGRDKLEELRFRLSKDINQVPVTGNTPITDVDYKYFGQTLTPQIYICTNPPTIKEDPDNPNQLKVTNCPNSSSNSSSNIRYIVVQVLARGRNNEKIYTVQGNFAQLQR